MESNDVAEIKRRAAQANSEVTCQLTMAMITFRREAHPAPSVTMYAMPGNCLDTAHDLAKMGATSILIWPGGGSSGWWFWRG